MEELSRLVLYCASLGLEVKSVQGKGSCMFASLRRCIDAPKEYTNSHLRCHLVKYVATNIEFLYPILSLHIRGNYGHLRLTHAEVDLKRAAGTLTQEELIEFNEQGPFSIVSYLEALLGMGFYGEEVCLVMVSMIWQVRITILDATSFIPTRICHTNTLENTDIVLV